MQDLGEGASGTVRLMQDASGELAAVKYIERGPQVDAAVEREAVHHRLLTGGPHIVGLREVGGIAWLQGLAGKGQGPALRCSSAAAAAGFVPLPVCC